MKKTLVVLLAVAMIFSFATTAMAFSDISNEKTATQDAINRFAAYGIINGYGEGIFLPDGSITRAEFAKVVIMYTGNTVLADALKNSPSGFSDVKVGEWYTGYVNAATTLEYFKGMGDGTFGVGGAVTYGQAATVLLRLAGFNDNLAGSWPYNYVAQGSKSGYNIVKAATKFDTAGAALRKDVVLMANTLLASQTVAYDSTKKVFVNYGTDVKALYGAINENAAAAINVGYNDKNGITINNLNIASNFAISDGFTILDIDGKNAVVVKDADNKVVYVDLCGKYVKGIPSKVSATAVTINGVTYSTALTINKTDYKIFTLNDTKDTVTAQSAALAEGTDNSMVVYEVNAKNLKGYAVKAATTFNINAANTKYIVIKDGKMATIADIEVGDLVYARPAIGTAVVYEVLSAQGDYAITSLTGKGTGNGIESFIVNGVNYKQDGMKYKEATSNVFADLTAGIYTTNKLKGVTGSFYADKYGNAVAMIYGKLTAATTSVIGMVMDGTVYEVSQGGTGVGVGAQKVAAGYSDLTILTSKGETVKYAVKDNGAKKGSEIFVLDSNALKLGSATGEIVAKGLVVKASLNEDGVITALAAEALTQTTNDAGANTLTAVNDKYNTVTIEGKVYSLPATTPVFQVNDVNSKKVYKTTTASAVISSLKSMYTAANGCIQYVLDKTGTAISYLVITDGVASQTVNTYAVLDSLFYEVSNVKFADGTSFEKDSNFKDNGAVKGDIVTYSLKDGKITDLTVKEDLASMSGATAVKAVSGAVISTAAANLVVDSKTVVFIYDKNDTVETTAKAFNSIGTLADVVKDANIIAGTANATTGALEYIIVVR